MAEWLGGGLQNLIQRFESASDLVSHENDKYTMGVTRLKRKDRRNKVVAKREVQFLKLGRNIEVGSRSKMSPKNQIVKNDEVLNKLVADLKK